MKKLVYLFAIVMGLSLVSCDWFTNKTNEENVPETEPIENVEAIDGDSLKDVKEGDSISKDAQPQEAKAEETKEEAAK